jgi:hypothetical protein
MSDTLEEPRIRIARELPFSLPLELQVDDRDVIAELEKYPEGPERDEFALEALKIGVLALRRASTALDGEFIQRETTRLLDTLRHQLDGYSRTANEQLSHTLKDYFDPNDGRFSQRVQSLTADNGDLAKLLAGSLDGENSKLAMTLMSHVGQSSPLMKHLSPDQSHGLISLLKANVETQLGQQRDRILKEFSLDNAEGALCRLVKELSSKHGDLSTALQSKIDVVVKEFSLNEENSALSRLVKNVDQAQRTITSEFSLDNERSGLSRLKAELMTIFSAHVEASANFQEKVTVALEKLVTKRETEARGTQHGGVFQDAVFAFLAQDAQRRGDIVEFTGNCVGQKKNCKVGDVVIHLGPECTAAGARIVVEAKQEARYSIRAAHEEIQLARINRGAQHGIFVFSRQCASQMEPLTRYGADVIVVWDAEDPQTDSYLRAAVEISRALCVRCQQDAERRQIDFSLIDGAINEIEKKAKNLEQVSGWAQTIHSNSEKIIERVRKDREALDKEVTMLRDSMGQVKHAMGERPSAEADQA